MSVTTKQYIKKSIVVEAVRVTTGNLEAVAEWCQGKVQQDTKPGDIKGTGKKYIKVRVHHPINTRQTKARPGDWILYTDRGYKIYTNKAFHESWVPMENESARPYPYDEGDVTVLGPECFVAQDGSVLNWRGSNYVLQETPAEELEKV